MDMSLMPLCLLLAALGGSSAARQETLCTSDACFTAYTARVSFETARQSCEHAGGYLMTVRDRGEEDVLRSLLSKLQWQHLQRPHKLWIGLKLRKGDCVLEHHTLRGFKWISGEGDSSYSNWDTEPARMCTMERCVRVLQTSSGGNQLKWAAGSCRNPSFYACKFYFKGMCKPLALLGPGRITYLVPFSEEPLHYTTELLPFGTFADVSCRDQQLHQSMCRKTDSGFHWSEPGPFCRAQGRHCDVDNGGCDQLCQQEQGAVLCFCKKGYSLEEDGFSCGVADPCGGDLCEHRCFAGQSGHSCGCLEGFKLDGNGLNCTDIDECVSGACGEHPCANDQGSYTCVCGDGYAPARDGRSCEDVDECALKPCQFRCVNTEGGFRCTCPRGFRASGPTCARETTDESTTEPFSGATVEPQRQSPPVPVPVNVSESPRQSNASSSASLAEAISSRVLICVLGSVLPLMLLVAVTLAIAIFRCKRSKKEAKKNAATDGYCWVSPGLDPRLEKLYESILTDDL